MTESLRSLSTVPSPRERANSPSLSILTVTTLFPNSVQKAHGIFVETRLRKLVETGEVNARVLAPVPWLPPFVDYAGQGKLRSVARHELRSGLQIEHPRYFVVPKVGMSLTPITLYRTLCRAAKCLLNSGFRPDVIDAHYFYPDGVAAVWLGGHLDIPVVVTARGTDVNLIPEFRIPRRLIGRAAAEADGLITVCQALKDELIELGVTPERVVVLRNGVDLELFRPLDRVSARKRLGLGRRTLGSVGHLIERKGHHHVIRALARLPDAELLIVGEGPERSALTALAEEQGVSARVHFLGTMTQSELCELYNALDVLVLASSREGWANVLLEAMACGTPVVASNAWGNPEVVTAPEAGMLMPTLDAAGIAAAIERLYASMPSREATRHYAEKFDWQPTTQGQLKLFREVLARYHPKS